MIPCIRQNHLALFENSSLELRQCFAARYLSRIVFVSHKKNATLRLSLIKINMRLKNSLSDLAEKLMCARLVDSFVGWVKLMLYTGVSLQTIVHQHLR
jgi:hypothetical protein